MKYYIRNKVIEIINDQLREAIPRMVNTEDSNIVGVYTAHFNNVMHDVVKLETFDDLDFYEKAYTLIYAQIRFGKAILDSLFGGDIDEPCPVDDLRKMLETHVDPDTQDRTEDYLRKLDALDTDLAPVPLSREVKTLVVEGVDELEKFRELSNGKKSSST